MSDAPTLKVAMNCAALMAPLTGIGQYTRHLVLGLQREPGIDLRLYYAMHFVRNLPAAPPRAVGALRGLVRRNIPGSYPVTRAIQQVIFSHGSRAGSFDLYHEPNFLAFRFPGPSVITVHDLSWIRYPETHPAERVRAMHRYFEPGLRRASLVITDSHFVRNEVIQEFGVPAERIVTVPLGLDPAFRPQSTSETDAVLSRIGLDHGSYFLSVGTLEPRKNMETTVAAYGALPPSLRERHPLVIAGLRGWRTSAMEKALEPLVASGHVRMLGYLERDELAAITAGALAMVYPSIYEGFGLPPLESMGCGVPVIASNVSSLPEVVGDTALLVDPLDVDALANAMRTMLEDRELRQSLADRALARSARFTWEACTQGIHAAYRTAVANSR
jgi:glycosyltransferase involved in cell wall biosynthesis